MEIPIAPRQGTEPLKPGGWVVLPHEGEALVFPFPTYLFGMFPASLAYNNQRSLKVDPWPKNIGTGYRKTARLSKRGFTLPELMVVLSIVMLLSGLLFPVFASARREAKRSACMSNLSQVHRAISLYMVDAEDIFPAGKDCLDIYAPVGYSQTGLAKLKAMPILSELLWPYTRSKEVFRCPMDEGAAVSESSFPMAVPLVPTAFGVCGLSYEYHTALGMAGVSGTALQNPTGVNLIEDLAGHWHGEGGMARPEDTRDAFNRRTTMYRYNVLYVDVHGRKVDYGAKERAWREK